jgi:hypothetical protein
MISFANLILFSLQNAANGQRTRVGTHSGALVAEQFEYCSLLMELITIENCLSRLAKKLINAYDARYQRDLFL